MSVSLEKLYPADKLTMLFAFVLFAFAAILALCGKISYSLSEWRTLRSRSPYNESRIFPELVMCEHCLIQLCPSMARAMRRSFYSSNLQAAAYGNVDYTQRYDTQLETCKLSKTSMLYNLTTKNRSRQLHIIHARTTARSTRHKHILRNIMCKNDLRGGYTGLFKTTGIACVEVPADPITALHDPCFLQTVHA